MNSNIYIFSINGWDTYIPTYFITNKTFKQFKQDIYNIIKKLIIEGYIDTEVSDKIEEELKKLGYVEIHFKEVHIPEFIEPKYLFKYFDKTTAFKLGVLLLKNEYEFIKNHSEFFTPEYHRNSFIEGVKSIIKCYHGEECNE